MLARRLQRWPNNRPTVAQCLVFAGLVQGDNIPGGIFISLMGGGGVSRCGYRRSGKHKMSI